MALIAARRMGRSITSRIAFSDSCSTSEVGTIDIVVRAIAKKASKVASLFGNLRLKIRLNSSRFCSQIIALLG